MENHFEVVSYAPKDIVIEKPIRGTKESAGYDFYAPIDIFIPAHGVSNNIPLFIKAYLSSGTFLQLKIRSGLAVKHSIILCTSGVIDSDYVDNKDNEGNICVKFANLSDEDFTIKAGERCCQGIIFKYDKVVDDRFLSEERVGGHGSTGIISNESKHINKAAKLARIKNITDSLVDDINSFKNLGMTSENLLYLLIAAYNEMLKKHPRAEKIFLPKAPHVDTPRLFLKTAPCNGVVMKNLCLGYESTSYYMLIYSGSGTYDDLLAVFLEKFPNIPYEWRRFMRTH